MKLTLKSKGVTLTLKERKILKMATHWEIESYGREVGLYQNFRPTLKLLKNEI